MNDLRKGQDDHNRQELKLLSRYHTNRDELQRFVVFFSVPPQLRRNCSIFLDGIFYSFSSPFFLPLFVKVTVLFLVYFLHPLLLVLD